MAGCFIVHERNKKGTLPSVEKVIFVTARIRARQGHTGELEQAASGLIAPTLDEAGCIFYELYRCADNPTTFLFFECWKDSNALAQHLRQPYVREFMKTTARLLDGQIEVTCWEKVDQTRSSPVQP